MEKDPPEDQFSSNLDHLSALASQMHLRRRKWFFSFWGFEIWQVRKYLVKEADMRKRGGVNCAYKN
jgi:hypothetical protein